MSHSSHALNEQQTTRLSLLAKTWGVAKNFHTGTCQHNWDQTLINVIPSIIEAPDHTTFNQHINDMLDGLGQNNISNQTIPQTPAEIRQKIDYSWVNDPAFTIETQNKIDDLINSFRPRTNCHVLSGIVGQGDYSIDDRFSQVLEPNAEQRLLAVFRFWNIINYYFPYKNLTNKPWPTVLDEYIPLIHDAQDSQQYQLLMRRFTAEINDSHAFFTSQSFNDSFANAHLPFRIKTIEGKAVIFNKTNQQNDINIGDQVISINGIDVNTLAERNSLFSAASNPVTLVRNTDYFYNVGESGPAQLSLINADGQHLTINSEYGAFPIELYQQPNTSWTNMDQTDCTVGYVNMGQLQTTQIPAMMQAFDNKDVIIFDIRNYPNGTLWTLVNYLYTTPIQVARFAQLNLNYPGAYRWNDTTIGQGTNNPYNGRLIILFNEETQSQAEYTIMGLEQHPNAVKIGSQTAAADGNITTVSLPGGINISFTGLGVYYPNNKPTQRIGIIPDLFIRPTIEGIREDRDEVLEAALNCDNILNLDWPQSPKPTSALFWDPKKSGKGIDIAEFNQNFTVIPYDFRSDGSPVWYLAVAHSNKGILNTDTDGFFEYRYDTEQQNIVPLPQSTQLSFDFKQGPFEIDCAIVTPENKQHYSRLLWNNDNLQESRCMEEFIFAPQTPLNNDFTGLWYGGEAENGWGLSINTQGNQLVAVIYYYDQQGQATWILGNTTFDTDQPMQFDMREFHGYCPGCDATEVTSTVVGQITLSLSQPSNQFENGNWMSLTTDNQQWNRDHMPIKMLSTLQ